MVTACQFQDQLLPPCLWPLHCISIVMTFWPFFFLSGGSTFLVGETNGVPESHLWSAMNYSPRDLVYSHIKHHNWPSTYVLFTSVRVVVWKCLPLTASFFFFSLSFFKWAFRNLLLAGTSNCFQSPKHHFVCIVTYCSTSAKWKYIQTRWTWNKSHTIYSTVQIHW